MTENFVGIRIRVVIEWVDTGEITVMYAKWSKDEINAYEAKIPNRLVTRNPQEVVEFVQEFLEEDN